MKTELVVITGASTGIGRATAVAFAKKQYRVVLIGRNGAALQETKRLVDTAGGEGVIILADLSIPEGTFVAAEGIKKLQAPIYVLANIAGVWHGEDEVFAGKLLQEFLPSVVTNTMMVGLISPLLLVQNILPSMSEQGVVVNLTGTFENGGKGWIPYYVSKRALEDFTRALAEEFEGTNRKSVCISPSDTATEQYEKYFPEDAVDANDVAFVAQEILSLVEQGKNGECVVVKKNKVIREGFHT